MQPRDPEGRLPGQVHYENLCMKAVNQSIGRSIRHAQDYACVLLADHRYARPSVSGKLPQWISSQLVKCDGFGPAFSAIRKVCADHSETITKHALLILTDEFSFAFLLAKLYCGCMHACIGLYAEDMTDFLWPLINYRGNYYKHTTYICQLQFFTGKK